MGTGDGMNVMNYNFYSPDVHYVNGVSAGSGNTSSADLIPVPHVEETCLGRKGDFSFYHVLSLFRKKY